MKTIRLKQLVTSALIFSCCQVLASRPDDPPPNCNLQIDYSGAVTQVATTTKTLDQTGVLVFNAKQITSNDEFEDFVTKTTIVVNHGGTDQPAKTLKVYLQQSDPTYLTTQKATAVTAKQIANFKVALSLLGVVENDKVTITCKVKAGVLTTASAITITKAVAVQLPKKPLPNLTVDAALITYLNGAGGNFEVDATPLSSIMANASRYDKDHNKAYLVVDQNGELIDNYPVNIDQDDIVYVIIVGKKSIISGYTADYTGTYSPVDLQMRSFTPVDPNAYKSNGAEPYNPDDYTVIVKKRGPFTSANVVVKVKDNANGGNVLATYTLTVNTLFHLGFGVAFNRTNLENPTYIVSPLNSTQNTVVKTDGGKRNLVSVNVIWYWSSTLKYLTRGDNITRGRDVLKEPNFLERINPTFGVALSGNITDNMFAGLTFEFARGGSIFGGYHFGLVKRLVDPTPGFVPGTTIFTGTSADIKTSNVSDQGFAFGLILDTRIFNALFKKGS